MSDQKRAERRAARRDRLTGSWDEALAGLALGRAQANDLMPRVRATVEELQRNPLSKPRPRRQRD